MSTPQVWTALGLLAGIGLVLRSRLDVVTVVGSSMSPTLAAGERVLMARPARPYRAGDIVLLASPDDPSQLFIKRVVATAGQPMPGWVPRPPAASLTVPAGQVVVLGEHPASLDSKSWGPVSLGLVRARLLMSLR